MRISEERTACGGTTLASHGRRPGVMVPSRLLACLAVARPAFSSGVVPEGLGFVPPPVSLWPAGPSCNSRLSTLSGVSPTCTLGGLLEGRDGGARWRIFPTRGRAPMNINGEGRGGAGIGGEGVSDERRGRWGWFSRQGAGRFIPLDGQGGSGHRGTGAQLPQVLQSSSELQGMAVPQRFIPRGNVWTPPRLLVSTEDADEASEPWVGSIVNTRADAMKGEKAEVVAVDEVRRKRYRVGGDLVDDFRRRSKSYTSDWKDGMNRKSLPAVLFLYFACLLPSVAFGGIAAQVTAGSMGVIEYIVASGTGGMAYAILSGQPMTIIGPTGLTLAFITALYSFTSAAALPFLPIYSWVGLWTSAMLMSLSLFGASRLIDYATQFTDDVFNALLAVNFIYEAFRSLLRDFCSATAQSGPGPLLGLNVALATYMGSRKASGAKDSPFFNEEVREFISDFGPAMVIVAMSMLSTMTSIKGSLSFLEVPSKFMLSQGRSWLSPVFSVPWSVRLASAVPAFLLTSLFFLDQNISTRVVNSPRHQMVKGTAYHLDLLVLGAITGILSVFGLPWQCAATVQSLNHVRAMAVMKSDRPQDPNNNGQGGMPVNTEEIDSVYETRVTGLSIHALVLASLGLLPLLRGIPMAVVSGIFLYLGRKVMNGNGFLNRIAELGMDPSYLSDQTSTIKRVGFWTSLRYTGIQFAMLSLLWTLKSFKRTALFFPSVIGLLIIVRLMALPKMFTPKELDELDASVG